MKQKQKATITSRFVKAMNEVIKNHRNSGGSVTTVKAFAKSLGHSASNFSKFSGKSRRDVTLEMVETICRKHHVNPTWLILGTGAMFIHAENTLEQRVGNLEIRVAAALREIVKNLKK